MDRVWCAAALALLVAGCAAQAPTGATNATTTSPTGPVVAITCRVTDASDAAIAGAWCRFETGDRGANVTVDAEGKATSPVQEGSRVRVTAAALGWQAQAKDLLANAPQAVRFRLEPAAPVSDPSNPKPSESGSSSTTGATTGPDPGAGGGPQPPLRSWGAPVHVADGLNEPQLVVAPDGTVYLTPLDNIYRSDDGGRTWSDVSPGFPPTLPVLASDTALSVAPDGSVWWSRSWGYLESTMGCTSTTKGAAWTCDQNAIPGVTDRMWIVGLDAMNGYLQTNEGLYHHVWASTLTGSIAYAPYATQDDALFSTRNGNMVYDSKDKSVWQIEFIGSTLVTRRIDGTVALNQATDTGLPAPYGLPWIALVDGVMWVTSEHQAPDGSLSVHVAHSRDHGATWTSVPVSNVPRTASLSSVAATPSGRVVVAYYGSNSTGFPDALDAGWDFYVAETDDGFATNPVWTEHLVASGLHQGSLCIAACSTASKDGDGRWAGDLLGIGVDAQGNAIVPFMRSENGVDSLYVARQDVVA